jgi:hypothetical protein
MVIEMKHIVYIVLLTSLLSGCAAVNVQYDYDPEADFTTIRTYAWRNSSQQDDALEANPLLKKRVERSVDNHLENKGFNKISDDIPDFYVIAHAGMQEKMRVTNTEVPMGYYPDYRYNSWRGGIYYQNRVDVHYYTEGTLIIDIVAAGKDELIWRGMGTGVVRQYDSPEDMQQSVDQYVNEILAGFPPPDTSN